jgi:hypothetical protein
MEGLMSIVRKAKLPRLHMDFTDVLSEMLKGEPLLDANGRAVLDEHSRPIYVRPGPAFLKVVKEFLKDNGIDSEPIEGGATESLAKALKQYDEPLALEEESPPELE